MLAMDQLARINLGAIFAIFVLPAWAVFRLQNPKISIAIGGLIFWCWLVLLGEFTLGFDPSYDSIGPAFNFLFGLPFGLGYCAFWEVIRRLLRRSKTIQSHLVGLVLWSGMTILCICFPYIFASIYHREPMDYFYEILFGVGPILLLCISMVLTMALDMRKMKKKTISIAIANQPIEGTA